MHVIIIVAVAALLGIWRYRSLDYFRWVAVLFVWMLAADTLFAGYGTLQDPRGDGLITRQIRIATDDGIGMGLFAIAFIVVYWGGVIFCITRLTSAARAARNAADAEGAIVDNEDGARDPTPRQAAETGLVLLLIGGWIYLASSAFPGGPSSSAARGPGALMDGNPASAATAAPAELDMESALKQVAAELNAEPTKSDGTTTLVRTEAAGRTLTYHYDVKMRGTGREDLRRFVEANVVPRACAHDEQRPTMRDHGVSYTYVYSSADLSEPLAVTIDEQRCRGLGQ